MLAFLAMNLVNVACLAWTPMLLYQKFHLSLAQSGFHATFYHHLGAFLGVLLGGRLADRWASRSCLSRPLIQTAGLVLGAPFVFLLGWADSSMIVFASLGLFGLFRGLYDSNLFASLYEVIRPEARATATGVMLAVAFLGGGSAAVAVGWFSQRVGLGSALASTSVFYLLAAGLLLVTSIRWFRRDAARIQGVISDAA
jgi:sugar phosphate permease